jgi:hypothetical protein
MLWTSLRPCRAAGPYSSSFRGALGRRPLFETLELRRMLANYTWDDAANTLLISLGNNESLTVSETGGNVAFTLSAGSFTQSGGNTAPGDGTDTITLAATDLTTSLTVVNGTVTTGTNNVTFSGAGSLSSAAIAVNLTDTDAVGTISFTGGFDIASTGVAGITLETRRDISVGSGTVISTVDGDITFSANLQPVTTAGNFAGIAIGGSTINTSGTGKIMLQGRGGNADSGNHGIFIVGVLESTGATDGGTITLDGTGGNGTLSNTGVFLNGASTSVTSASGAIAITGKGGNGSGPNNYGILVANGAAVESTGATDGATITLNGTGGDATSLAQSNNYGVILTGTNTKVTSASGDIDITGKGGDGPHSFNYGILVANGAVVESTGATDGAAITLDGTGGNGMSRNHGVHLTDANTKVTSVSGDISVTGTGGDDGSSADNYGILVANGAVVESTGATDGATITLDGTGGNSLFFNIGISLTDANTKVTSMGGAIFITGQGGNGPTGPNNYGVFMADGAVVESTGASDGATISLDGTGGIGTTNNHGVFLTGANTKVISASGAIDIIAERGGADFAPGLRMTDNSAITSTGSANVTLISDSIGIDSSAAGVNAGANTVTIKTKATNGSIGIDFGGADNAGTLGLTDAELDLITAGKIIIGDAATPNTITVSAAIQHAGDADFEVLTARNIVFNSSSSWTTANGSLTFLANQGVAPTSGDFVGIDVDAATIISTASGDLLLDGRGGNTDGFKHGILVQNASKLESTGIGTITLDGHGGNGTDEGNFGVWVTDAETEITSVSGAIEITGKGGDGTSSSNGGIFVGDGAVVESTGVSNGATITFDGIGGTSTHHSLGVWLSGANTKVTSVSGTIDIVGHGGTGTVAASYAIYISGGALVESTGAIDGATITIDGTGGSGAYGNYGIWLSDANSKVTSVSGAIELIGQGGDGVASPGILADVFGFTITSTGTANITLTSDDIQLDPTNLSIVAGANTVTIKPKSTDGTVGVELGDGGSSSTLVVSDDVLDRITAGKLTIGSANAGQIEVTADITRTAATNIELVSGDDIAVSVGQINTGGGTLLLHPGTSPAAVQPTKAGIDATASTVSFASDLAITIDGATLDTGYNQLHVVGAVDLAGVDLVLSGGYVPLPGNVFTIVAATSVSGEFNGLDDGSKVTFNGVDLAVHYTATAVTLTIWGTAEDVVVLGAEAGAEPRVKVLDAKDGSVVASFLAYSSTFRGGVRVAVADLNGDGTAEIIVAPGAGMSTLIKVFDLDGNELDVYRTKAYIGFSGGVFVATGDLNGDGRPDLITTPGSGLSSVVKVFRNRVQHMSAQKPYAFTKNPLYAFLAFGNTFTGGATVAAGNLTGDSRAEIIVGNGPGMGPRVRVFDVSQINPPVRTNLAPFTLEIRPFNTADRGGVSVAVGDVRGDTTPEIIIGNGIDGRGRIEMYNADGNRFKSVTAYNDGEGRNAPVHVATKSVDADALAEVLTGQGSPGSIGRLRSFNDDGTIVDDVFEGEDDFRFGFFVA